VLIIFNPNYIISTWTSGEGSSKYSVSKQIIIYCTCYLEITTRYLARHLSKKSSCDLCINGLKNCSQVTKSKSELVNLKIEGFLTHPNKNLFNILQVLESCFTKHASSPDVFENTYNEFFLISTNLKFPCPDHNKQMMADIFSFYIIMRIIYLY